MHAGRGPVVTPIIPQRVGKREGPGACGKHARGCGPRPPTPVKEETMSKTRVAPACPTLGAT